MRAAGNGDRRIGNCLEGKGQIIGRLKTLFRIFFQAAPDDAFQSDRYVRRELRNRRRLLVENGADSVGFCRFLKRTPTHNRFVEDSAEGENIGALVRSEPADLFWRHVPDGAQRYARKSN